MSKVLSFNDFLNSDIQVSMLVNASKHKLLTFEQYKLLEESKMMISISNINNNIRQKFVIPVGNVSVEEARRIISEYANQHQQQLWFPL